MSPRSAGPVKGDAFWAKNTSAAQQKQNSGGLLSKVLDVVVGPDVEHYGFIIASLEESDERHVKQLTKALPKDNTLPRYIVYKLS